MVDFAIHWHESALGVHGPLSWTPLPPPSPSHPSGLSQCTGSQCPVSCFKLGLVIYLTYDNIHFSMQFSQIIPPSPSPTESRSLFFTPVSLLLSYILGHRYHLSKFHICALIYCIGVFLSDLLHSVIASSFIHFIRTDSDVFFFNSWVIFHCLYVPQLSYPFICRWTSRLLPCPGYCEQCCNEQYTCLFQFWFPRCVCPAVGLLGQMAILFSVF